MFKLLREKITGWFGKKETKDSEKETELVKAEEKKTEKKPIKKKEKPVRTEETYEKEEIANTEISNAVEQRAEEFEEVQKVFDVELEKEIIEEKEDLEVKESVQAEAEEKEDLKLEEETSEEKEEGEKKGFFSRLVKSITTNELTKNDFEDFFYEFEITLLENNLALEVVDKIKESLSENLIGKKFKKNEAKEKILQTLKDSIDEILLEGEDLVEKIKESRELPFVILFFGINGSGKTTSIAKFAYKLKEKNISCILAAGDTFRAASIEQLEAHGKTLGLKVIKQDYKSDPAAVAFDAIQYAKKNKIKVVLIDTAGRMYTQGNLMKEMEKIVKVSKPNFKIFVGESITGNDATEQAKIFNETAGIDGIILTKADVDEKAGTILSVGYVTGKPILYLGVGQKYEDLQLFKKNDVLKNLGLE